MTDFSKFFTNTKQKRKVLFIASECAPFIKAGGLGEVMFSLPRALRTIGYDARVIIPLYKGIDREKYSLSLEMRNLEVPTDAEPGNNPDSLICNVYKYENQNKDYRAPAYTYFLENQEYYEQRANVYGYADDPIRWALLSRGALQFLRLSNWQPDVIVAADWQGAFAINYLKTIYKDDPKLKNIATIFSIHNLYYQGMFDHHFVAENDFDDGHSPLPSFYNPRLLKLNMMRRGIMYADIINTVSPTYANEITTPDYGELLDGLLRERRSNLYGILNGIDYEKENPATDQYIYQRYDANNISKRILNKEFLQEKFGLPKDKEKFIIGIISRFDEQKGLDLLFETMEFMLNQFPVQFVIVGSGDAKYMNFFSDIAKKYPDKVSANLNFDTIIPHFILSGADAILIPSKFEPCGLTQMEAMRYGAIPIVRKTGGLADTVEDYDPEKNSGTGFSFTNFNGLSMTIAITRAFENYRHKEIWKNIQLQAMKKNFSWEHSAQQYGEIFEKAIRIVKEANYNK